MTRIALLPDVIIAPLVQMALAEDLGRAGDITSQAVIPPDAMAAAHMTAREEGCIAGLDIAVATFKAVDATLEVEKLKQDGDTVTKGDAVLRIAGRAQSVLTAERVALNFVGRLSGIATLTLKMVTATGNHKAKIAATRKTTPGLRAVEKYAVQVAGGLPHRFGLDDAVMIKDNHIAFAGGVALAVRRARDAVGHTVKVEVEVDTLSQLEEAMTENPDIVMLDNMSLEDMAEAVRIVNGHAVVEASGNVTLDRIPDIAATGVDVISSGAITHSAPNFDVGLDDVPYAA
ncbi:MAG: carboxylating nicotinate-nucleotide diphosphorylase [Alphaproteobacteria bacterium]|nr:carboxylating nicotinate-nucleotide diphosphorylase [Alphaproteobacteria bacterium]